MTTALHHRSGIAPSGTQSVVIYTTGTVITALESTTYSVLAGHSFRVGDKVLRDPTSNLGFAGSLVVASVTAKTVTMSGDVTGDVGDYLLNLGPDQGNAAPLYNQSHATIYSDSLGTTPIQDATITTPDHYSYYHKGQGRLVELFLDADGHVLEVCTDHSWNAALGLADFGVVGDGVTDETALIGAACDAIAALSGILQAWPDDTYLITEDITISASNVTLDWRGSTLTGDHRFTFEGDSGVAGDRSNACHDVHFLNANLTDVSGVCPKGPRLNWCTDSSVEDVSKTGTTGTAFNFKACLRCSIKRCTNTIGRSSGGGVIAFLIHVSDYCTVEHCTLDGDGTPFIYGIQIKGGEHNHVHRCTAIDIVSSATIDAELILRDRGDAPWGSSSTGDATPTPTYPWSEPAGADPNPWYNSDTRRASRYTVFSDCRVIDCDGHNFHAQESQYTKFTSCISVNAGKSGFAVKKNNEGAEVGFVIDRCTAISPTFKGFSAVGEAADQLLSDVEIRNCRVELADTEGLSIQYTEDAYVANVLVLNSGQALANTYIGLEIKSENTAPTILRCESSDDQVSATQKTGIQVSLETTDAVIQECLMLDNITNQFVDNGTNTTATNNVASTDSFTSFTDGDTTPSVSAGSVTLAVTANTSATTITTFDDGAADQNLTVLLGDEFTTILPTPTIQLRGDVPVGPNMLGPLITFTYTAGVWIEQRRLTL